MPRKQFVWNEFEECYTATDKKYTYYPSVIINERLYELKISDIPPIPYFPVNAYYEWTDYRFYGLRNATAYILVFDLSNVDSFQYVRTMREQLMESRDMSDVPLVIVGNKQDLVQSVSDSQHKRKLDDITSLVTKHWKCSYVECSAKFNWKVMQLFKQVMEMIDLTYTLQPQRDGINDLLDTISDEGEKSKCLIL